MLGAVNVEKSLAAADDFSCDFQEPMTEYCWGIGCGRTTLPRRDLNLVMLGLLNRFPASSTTLHLVHDLDGNVISEYDGAGTHELIGETAEALRQDRGSYRHAHTSFNRD